MSQISLNQREVRTVRDAMREMNSLLEMLRRGEVEKIVLVKSGEMKGVIVSVDEYSRLTSAK